MPTEVNSLLLPLRLGTRATPLAVAQSTLVAENLRSLGHTVELVTIVSHGDRSLGGSLAQAKGAFTTELNDGLLSGRVDLVVHSLKDLPTAPEPGLTVAAIPIREPAHDLLVQKRRPEGAECRASFQDLCGLLSEPSSQMSAATSAVLAFDQLEQTALLGTSSPRRQSAALELRKDLLCCAVRGSVGRRLEWLRTDSVDALLLAEAGLRRLVGDEPSLCEGLVAARLALDTWPCAAGQGALAIQVATDGPLDGHASMRALHDPSSATSVEYERALLTLIGGGCQQPLGAAFTVEGDQWSGHAHLASPHWRTAVAAGAAPRVTRWSDSGAAAETTAAIEAAARKLKAEAQAADIATPTRPQPQASSERGAQTSTSTNVLVTSSQEAATRLLSRVLEHVDANPATGRLRVHPLELTLAQPCGPDWPVEQVDLQGPRADWPWLLVSSPSASRVIVERTKQQPIWGRLPWCALGEGTARSLLGLGVPPNLIANARDGTGMASFCLQQIGELNPFFVPHSKSSAGGLVRSLEQANRRVIAWGAYEFRPLETVAWPPSVGNPPDVVLFTAPSRVQAFAQAGLPWPKRSWAIGEPTAEALRAALPTDLKDRSHLTTAATPDAKGVLHLFLDLEGNLG